MPLETILKKALHKAPARLQRKMVRLQRYRFDVTYKKGSSLHLAGHLFTSRTPSANGGFEVFRLEVQMDDRQPTPRLFPGTESRLRRETQNDASRVIMRVRYHFALNDLSVL